MLYVNISKERKLICSKRQKVWVNPGKEVEIDGVDRQFLGINASALMPKSKYDKKVAKRNARIRARREKRKAVLAAKKKTSKKKIPIKEKVKKLAKKVVAKKKEPTAAELKKQRAELKDILSGMNKTNLIDFGENALKMDIKKSDKKDSIVTKVLNASKKVGYKKIIKKA